MWILWTLEMQQNRNGNSLVTPTKSPRTPRKDAFQMQQQEGSVWTTTFNGSDCSNGKEKRRHGGLFDDSFCFVLCAVLKMMKIKAGKTLDQRRQAHETSVVWKLCGHGNTANLQKYHTLSQMMHCMDQRFPGWNFSSGQKSQNCA